MGRASLRASDVTAQKNGPHKAAQVNREASKKHQMKPSSDNYNYEAKWLMMR